MKKFLNLFHTKYVYGIGYDCNGQAIYFNSLYEECELKPNDIIKPMEDNISNFHGGGPRKLIKGVYYSFSYKKDKSGHLEEYNPTIFKIFKIIFFIKNNI